MCALYQWQWQYTLAELGKLLFWCTLKSWEFQKKNTSGVWEKKQSLCGTAVINLWDLLKYDILLRKSFHSDESSSSNFTNFLPSRSHASRAEELPMLSY